MQIINEVAYTFDDVLLVPQYTEINSRKDVVLKTNVTRNVELNNVFLSANMDTITENRMATAMHQKGCLGVFHRFITNKALSLEIEEYVNECGGDAIIAISVGVNEGQGIKDKIDDLKKYKNPVVLFIDVPNAFYNRVGDLIEFLKSNYNYDVVAGNVATANGAKYLCEKSVDGVKVNIGAGSMCTTRKISGHGVPQITALLECAEVCKKYSVPIIADGGCKDSGDCVKSLACGASSIMSGFLFRGTSETPGEAFKNDGILYKTYRGMASIGAQTKHKGKGYHAAPEGESKVIRERGSVKQIVDNLLAGIRSGLSYSNAKTINEFHNNAILRIISSPSIIENSANGLRYD